MRILIADDSVISRHVLESTLLKWQYEVTAVCDGLEAWRCLEAADPPRLAILDWMMPGMTGIEICRELRKKPIEPYTYILLLTSRNEKQDLIAGMEAGADDYITKPFDYHELNVRLRAGRRIVELQDQLVRAREKLREQATRDSLTGIWNRYSILDFLRRELARADREDRPVGVVLLDLDHFKQVNDTHGHLAGDEVLRECARRMATSIRPYDAIGRYGGEEFLVVLPGCDGESTKRQAERLRQAISAEPIKAGEAQLLLTASFGTTTAPAYWPGSIEKLIDIADGALYQAKEAGRNRVVYSQALTRPSLSPSGSG